MLFTCDVYGDRAYECVYACVNEKECVCAYNICKILGADARAGTFKQRILSFFSLLHKIFIFIINILYILTIVQIPVAVIDFML